MEKQFKFFRRLERGIFMYSFEYVETGKRKKNIGEIKIRFKKIGNEAWPYIVDFYFKGDFTVTKAKHTKILTFLKKNERDVFENSELRNSK